MLLGDTEITIKGTKIPGVQKLVFTYPPKTGPVGPTGPHGLKNGQEAAQAIVATTFLDNADSGKPINEKIPLPIYF